MTLEDYKVDNNEITYLVRADVPLDEKLTLLHQFLAPYHYSQECNFIKSNDDIDTENGQETVFSYMVVGPNISGAPKMMICTAKDAIHRQVESKALEQAWVDILELRIDLSQRWDGSGYHVGRMRSLNAKVRLLEQFLTEHEGSEFDIESGSTKNKFMRIVANPTSDKVRLLIEYSDLWLHEASKLLEVLTSRLQPPPPASPWEML
jgi:hypothetical protein